MIVDVQGGDEKSEYENKLIKKYSERLTSELGKGYSIILLNKLLFISGERELYKKKSKTKNTKN